MEPEEFRIPQAPKPSQSDKIATHQHHRKQHPMKLTHTLSVKPKSGMTLLELTVVILVLLSLISILFIGARAWKKGSDRAANILNIRNVQQAVRGHMNMNGILTPATAGAGVALANSTVIGSGKYLNAPAVPAAALTYSYLDKAPAVGELYLIVSGDTTLEYTPAATTTAEW
jgi:type II secretory pathway pseudopilin PulG